MVFSKASEVVKLGVGHFIAVNPEWFVKANFVNRTIILITIFATHHKTSCGNEYHLNAIKLLNDGRPIGVGS